MPSDTLRDAQKRQRSRFAPQSLGFLWLTEQLQEELLGVAMGERGVKISYDPFFKKLFDPEEHGDRLSRMLSQILGFEVQVKRGLLFLRSDDVPIHPGEGTEETSIFLSGYSECLYHRVNREKYTRISEASRLLSASEPRRF